MMQDFPVCPYLVGTVWQYGDSEAGGWVYDPSLRVTCPAHPCSRLHCGFRAECRRDRGSGTTSQSSFIGFTVAPAAGLTPGYVSFASMDRRRHIRSK